MGLPFLNSQPEEPETPAPAASWTERLRRRCGFKSRTETLLWSALSLAVVPLSMLARFWFWNNALLEPHPIRQMQTALTVLHLHKGTVSLFDYRSPLNGSLWNFVFEFPLYQWLGARLMDMGLGLEVAVRTVSMASFFACTAVLITLVNRFLGKRVAAWTALLWLISPLTVLHSRSCLIDFFAAFLSITSLGIFLEVYLGKRKLSGRNWAAMTTFGFFAGLSKVTVWFAPTLFQGMLLVYATAKARKVAKRDAVLGVSLALQTLTALAWMRWANHLRQETGVLTTHDWIFGSLSQRFEWECWKPILNYVQESVFQSWMVVPFLLAYFKAPKDRRYWLAGLTFLFLCPTLVTFNVQRYHDYYLIGVVAYFIVVAALGMTTLFALPKRQMTLCLSVMGVFFAWRMKNSYNDFAPIYFDYRTRLGPELALNKLTSPDDLIFYQAGLQDYEIPLYSDRLVGLGGFGSGGYAQNSGAQADGKNPTVFKLDAEKPKLSVLDAFDPIWLDGSPDFYVYRVAKRGKFGFDPRRSLAVATRAGRLPDYLFDQDGSFQVTARPHPSSYLVVQLMRPGSRVTVKALESDTSFVLPRREFLFLPAPASEHPETYEISLTP